MVAVSVAACETDRDGDGWTTVTDCNDDDASISPDADEVCDGIDNDCDGKVDDQDNAVIADGAWYEDADGDGFGSNTLLSVCEAVEGSVEDNSDCDDDDADVFPGQGC